MKNIYKLLFFTLYEFTNFFEELRGGSSSKMKTIILLSAFGTVCCFDILFLINKIIDFPISWIADNKLISIIAIYIVVFIINNRIFDDFSEQIDWFVSFSNSKSQRNIGIVVTVLSMALSITLFFIL